MRYLFSFLFFCFANLLFAKDGYEIRVKLDNYAEKQLLLGYHFGDKQYIKDTVTVDNNGWFVFKGDKALDGGMYLIITLPDKQFFQVLVSKGEQHFAITTDAKLPVDKCKVKGSPDNELFYNYMQWLGKKREEAEKIKADIKKDSANLVKIKPLQDKLDGFDKEVKDYQRNLIEKNKTTLTALILKGSLDIEVPEFKGTEKEVQNNRYFWYKEHFFDNFNFEDERLIRTPILHNRTDYYLNKLVVQHPDSLIKAVDVVLKLAKKQPECYKYYLISLLNFYAKSNIVGQDALYVHLARQYYEKGECTPWIEKDELDKIIKNAKDLEPTLLGKVGQDLVLEKEDGTKINLYDLKTPYTILLFWAPDCGHCQKEMPKLSKFWDKWSKTGKVSMISVCNKVTDKVPDCWKFIKDNPGMNWINTVDTYLFSKYPDKYYVKSTPQVYIMDKDHKIIMKKIEAEQLDTVMDEIIKMDAEKLKEGK
jgi:thiol-disulfide isomerase/thioredoxin